MKSVSFSHAHWMSVLWIEALTNPEHDQRSMFCKWTGVSEYVNKHISNSHLWNNRPIACLTCAGWTTVCLSFTLDFSSLWSKNTHTRTQAHMHACTHAHTHTHTICMAKSMSIAQSEKNKTERWGGVHISFSECKATTLNRRKLVQPVLLISTHQTCSLNQNKKINMLLSNKILDIKILFWSLQPFG